MVGGVSLSAIADRFSTPVHVLHEDEMRSRCQEYRNVLPDAEIMHIGDHIVRSSRLMRCLTEEGMALALGSGKAVEMARAVGVPAQRVLAVGTRSEDIELASKHGCGRMVAGSTHDVRLLAQLAGDRQNVLVDVAPRPPKTGDENLVHIDREHATTVVRWLLSEESLRFGGLRCVVGTAATDVSTFEAAARQLVRLIGEMRDAYGVVTRELAIAGEHRRPGRNPQSEFDLRGFATRLAIALRFECTANRLRVPRLLVEPGRSLTAQVGVTLQRVVSIAAVGLVVVDGPGDGRSTRLIGRTSAAPLHTTSAVGRDGAVLDDVRLPADLQVGDLLATSGADVSRHVPLVSVDAGSAF
jgi:diaminopimelate decarboxylase